MAVSVKDIPVEKITVSRSHRTPMHGKVAAMAESLRKSKQLLQPIMVRKSKTSDDKYDLVFGAHRLAAAKAVPWKTIPAIITTMGDLECKLAEIDENIERANLSVIEESSALAERQRIYTELALKPTLTTSPQQGTPCVDLADATPHTSGTMVSDFVADTAATTGLSERTVERRLAAGKTLSTTAVDILKDTPTGDSQAQVTALAALPKSEQVEVAKLIKAGEADSVKEAIAARDSETPDEPEEPEVSTAVLQAINTEKIKPTKGQRAQLAAMPEEDQDAILEAVLAGRQSLGQAIDDGPAEPGPEEVGKKVAKTIESWCHEFDKLVATIPDDPWIKDYQSQIDGDIAALKKDLRFTKSEKLCPACEGDGCKGCRKTGRVNTYHHKLLAAQAKAK